MPERRSNRSGNGAHAQGRVVAPTRLSWPDLLAQALASISARPGRTVMTMLGTVLGIGAFVAVLGLTATATGQISATFSVLRATEVTVTDAGTPDIDNSVWSLPDEADDRARTVIGVTEAGTTWALPGSSTSVAASLDPRVAPLSLTVAAATPGYLRAIGPVLASGTMLNEFQERNSMRVAVLGNATAQQLGISSTALNPTIFIGGTAFTVIGIIGDADRQSTALSTVFIPASTAKALYGNPRASSPAIMLVTTELGAADQVADQLPIALRPDQPDLLRATASQAALDVQNDIYAALNPVFLALAALTLLIGAVGIANTTLVAVIERTREIGLRRALGARSRDIHTQILTEAILTGALGGLIGTALAVTVVVTTALALQWTAILDPTYTLSAPLIGMLTGALAGIYPAAKAAKIAPIDALRH